MRSIQQSRPGRQGDDKSIDMIISQLGIREQHSGSAFALSFCPRSCGAALLKAFSRHLTPVSDCNELTIWLDSGFHGSHHQMFPMMNTVSVARGMNSLGSQHISKSRDLLVSISGRYVHSRGDLASLIDLDVANVPRTRQTSPFCHAVLDSCLMFQIMILFDFPAPMPMERQTPRHASIHN